MSVAQTSSAFLMGGVALAAVPASAQAPVPAQPAFALSPGERNALAPVSQAVAARNWPAALSSLATAQNAAQTQNGRYALGRLQLDIGVGTANRQLQAAAIDTILGSGVAPPQEQALLYRHQAGLAFEAGNFERAEQALTRMIQVSPNDPEALAGLALVSRSRNNVPQSVNYLVRSLDASEATGRQAPESRYKLALATALNARLRTPGADLARRLVAFYPSNINWRDALLAYRELVNGIPPLPGAAPVAGAASTDPVVVLETMRLMRATGALAGERDYLSMAQALNAAGLPGEAKAVLDEGVERGMLAATDAAVRAAITSTNTRAASDRTALAGRVTQARAAAAARPARVAGDGLYGFGRYAEAAELYRLALTKTGEDANLLNLRLGSALALAGQSAEAEAALQAVTGERAELARFWLTWLARRTA